MKVCTACGAEYGDEVLFCQRDGTPLRKSGAASDLVGQVIAERYHITRKLGEGGMGQVYLAEHVKMGRQCAIKILTPGTMSDPDAISRFNREAANASRISHPNVCAIYDFGETSDGLIYLAMEFIEGRSLTDLLKESNTIPLARAATMIQQCAEALQVAHELGIVHRDLKPDNIMVVTARGKDTVKVVDFGIAKAIGGDGGAQKVTKTGFVVGTPEYMSPEQLSGDPVDGRSDLYSLGLVFYRMLTGASPFPAESQQETMIKRLTDDPLPLATARPDVAFPPALQRCMDRALARSPDDRYVSAADFARDVRTLATTVTGKVDLDAGTQVVRSEGTRPAPATRIDPHAQRKPAGPATGIRPAPARRGLPVLPLAAGALVLLLGGGWAFRDRLLGHGTSSGQNPSKGDTTTTTHGPGGGDTGAITTPGPPSPPDTPLHVVRPPPPPPSNPGGPVKPSDQGTGSHPAAQPTVVLPDPDDVFDPSLRDGARQKALAIYKRRDVPDTLRAMAAFTVASAYQEDRKLKDACAWSDSAFRLRRDSIYIKLKVSMSCAGQ
jgi:serine/threonine-protein kinase